MRIFKMNTAKIKRVEELLPLLTKVDCIYKCEKGYVGEAISYLNDYLDKLKQDDNKTT